jgi:outer membrane protein OmpA-like peptidoglycan-associated protein
MKKCSACLVLIISLGVNQLFSQQDTLQLSEKDSVIVSSWMVSLGINIVDDSGDAFNDFTTIKDQWNMVPFPSRISIGRYFRSGLGIEAIGTYNKYKEGFIIDGIVNPEDKHYFGLDTRLSFDLNKLVGETGWFDPYIGAGVGYTEANDLGRGTYNAVLGFRTWFSEHWGLDLNTSGKWSFGNKASNHIQHAAGVVYRFDIKKELSKKGKEKLALMEEQQRVADSIATAKKAEEEAAALAERLEREKEAARLAAAEKARLEALKKRMADLQSAIDALGHVYFKYDSFELTDEAKDVLAGLSELMNENTDIRLRIEGHTDSRGSAAYNIGLSERRAGHVMAYMLDHGVTQDQLHPEGFGESRLANECADGVRCSESKHRENRRSEFYIIDIR